jgi:hypothetical protein
LALKLGMLVVARCAGIAVAPSLTPTNAPTIAPIVSTSPPRPIASATAPAHEFGLLSSDHKAARTVGTTNGVMTGREHSDRGLDLKKGVLR